MWKWILNELQKATRALKVNSIIGLEEDDIVSIVALYLCQNKNLAKEIYENKKIGLLYQLVKCEIFEQKSKLFFESKMELSLYQRISSVCNEYGIEMKPENAYKISAILEDTSANFNISGIVALLSAESNPLNYGYSYRTESLERLNNRIYGKEQNAE